MRNLLQEITSHQGFVAACKAQKGRSGLGWASSLSHLHSFTELMFFSCYMCCRGFKRNTMAICLHVMDQTLRTKFYHKLSLYGYNSKCVPLCAILCPEVFSVSSSNQAAVEMCLSSIQHTFPSFPVQGKGEEKGQQVPRSCSSEELGWGQGQAPRLLV